VLYQFKINHLYNHIYQPDKILIILFCEFINRYILLATPNQLIYGTVEYYPVFFIGIRPDTVCITAFASFYMVITKRLESIGVRLFVDLTEKICISGSIRCGQRDTDLECIRFSPPDIEQRFSPITKSAARKYQIRQD